MKFNRPHTIEELASVIGARPSGTTDVRVHGLNEIHKVEPGDLTFADHPKYIDKALRSAATAILVDRAADCPPGKALLVSARPFHDFNLLIRHFMDAHAGGEPAEPGPGTEIMPGARIGKDVRIGSDCTIYPGVYIGDRCVIGDGVVIQANTVIGGHAFYYKRTPDGYERLRSCGRVVVHDRVEIGAGCTIDRGVTGDTVIGAGTKLDNLVHIGHDSVIGRNCLFAAQVGVAGVVTIEDDVILWGQVGVQKDLTIGAGAVVLGQSGIAKSLKGHVTYFGSPVREAREKMKELAQLKRLPELVGLLRGEENL
jgi:UDP-3-O-[3-hydroxymyristoyl] glucosamine N-acyltransferase